MHLTTKVAVADPPDNDAPRPSGKVTNSFGGFAHIPALDGVRGMAILLVMVVHLFFGSSTSDNSFAKSLIAIRNSGWIGVDLFFVLSGFLITGILYDTLSQSGKIVIFYGRRFLRIFPLYYFSLLVVCAIAYLGHHSWQGSQWYWLLYIQNTPAVFGGRVPLWQYDHLNHLWSLAVEEQFYLIWPWLVWSIKSRRTLMRLALFLAAAAPLIRTFLVLRGMPPYYEYILLPCRMDSLCLGSSLALAFRGEELQSIRKYASLSLKLSGLVLLVAFIREGGLEWMRSRFVTTLGFSLIAVFFTSLLALTIFSSAETAMFSKPLFRWYGKYSYGIYVWHMILPAYVVTPVRTLLRSESGSRFVSLAVSGFLAILVSTALGFVSYHGFEKYFLRLKRVFSYAETATPTLRVGAK